MDLLLERSEEIKKEANESSKQLVENKTTELNGQWCSLLDALETRRETLVKLAQHWEVRFVPFFLSVNIFYGYQN